LPGAAAAADAVEVVAGATLVDAATLLVARTLLVAATLAVDAGALLAVEAAALVATGNVAAAARADDVLPVLTVALAAPPQAARRGMARPLPNMASKRRRGNEVARTKGM
jgi:hypothetical protein